MKKKSLLQRYRSQQWSVYESMWMTDWVSECVYVLVARAFVAFKVLLCMCLCVCGTCDWSMLLAMAMATTSRIKIVKEEISWHFFRFILSLSPVVHFHCWFCDRSRWNINQSIEEDRNPMWYTLYHKTSIEQHLKLNDPWCARIFKCKRAQIRLFFWNFLWSFLNSVSFYSNENHILVFFVRFINK